MKIFKNKSGGPQTGVASRRKEEGLATMVFITLLAIMMILAAANTAALIRLHREVRLLEQQQIKRLNGSQTNSVPAKLSITRSNQDE